LRIARRLFASSLAAALGLAGTLGLAPGAHADTTTSLDLGGFHQMIVDSTDGYVFISEGLASQDMLNNTSVASSALVVADLSGNYVTTIDSGDGVEGIALSTGGTTLYAALASKGEVAAISITSIKTGQPSQAFYSVPSPAVPYGVAAQSGKLWVSSNQSPTASGSLLGYFDLTAATAAYTPDPAYIAWSNAADLAADPRNTGLVVAADPGTSATGALTVDAAMGSVLAGPALLSLDAASTQCPFENQLAVIPGTQKFIVGCSEQGDYTFDADDLSSPVASLTSKTPLPNFAISSDGTIAASLSDTTANLYQPDGTLADVLPLGSPTLYPGAIVVPGDLALSADASKLFVVLQDLDNNSYVLQSFDQPLTTRSTVTLSAPPLVYPGQTVPLTGTLALATGNALPSGTTVTIQATPGSSATVPVAADGTFSFTDQPTALGSYTYTVSYAGDPAANIAGSTATAQVTLRQYNAGFDALNGPATAPVGSAIAMSGTLSWESGNPPAGTPIVVTRTPTGSQFPQTDKTTDATGDFTFTDTPPGVGSYTYTFMYPGTSSIEPARISHVVTVSKRTPTLTLTAKPATGLYDSAITVTAHLGGTYTNRTVTVYAQLVGTGTKKLLKTAAVNSSGNLVVSYPTATRNVIFTATFSGDARYLSRSVSVRVGIAARVAMANGGWYATSAYNGTVYHVYHHTAPLNTAVTVTPNKHGECVRLDIENLVGTTWTSASSGLGACHSLNSASVLAGYVSLTSAPNGRYRLQAIFYPSSSDVTNVSYYSGWFYFQVVK
jgi:hypothetical protein